MKSQYLKAVSIQAAVAFIKTALQLNSSYNTMNKLGEKGGTKPSVEKSQKVSGSARGQGQGRWGPAAGPASAPASCPRRLAWSCRAALARGRCAGTGPMHGPVPGAERWGSRAPAALGQTSRPGLRQRGRARTSVTTVSHKTRTAPRPRNCRQTHILQATRASPPRGQNVTHWRDHLLQSPRAAGGCDPRNSTSLSLQQTPLHTPQRRVETRYRRARRNTLQVMSTSVADARTKHLPSSQPRPADCPRVSGMPQGLPLASMSPSHGNNSQIRPFHLSKHKCF